MKTLCVTGHRPEGLPWKKDKDCLAYKQFITQLKTNVEYAISKGYTHFISGGALGIDSDFASLILLLKKEHSSITLEIAVPCKTQSSGWSEEEKAEYDYILSHADKVTILSEKYYPLCMLRRNEYMVDKSDAVLCCFNGVKKGGTYSTIKYAQKQGKNFLLIDLNEQAPNGGNQMLFFKDKII